MRKIFTKLTLSLALFLLISVNAFSAGTTTHAISVQETFDCSNANITAAGTTWVTYSAASYSARTNTCDNGSYPNLSGTSRSVVFYVSGCASFTITAEGNSVNTRILQYQINGGTAITTAVYGAGCSSQTFSTGNTGNITITVSGNNGSIYLGNVTFLPPAAPTITAFSAAGVSATINHTAKTITAELPYGTNMTSITPTVTLGGTATSYTPTGAVDFSGGAVNYIASDGTPANDVTYAVTLTAAATPSSDKDLSAVTIGGYTPVFNSGTNSYSVILPKASSLTQAVAFTKPLTANANFTSGNTYDFTNPLSITVTAQDNSTKVYTLSATTGAKNIAYVVNTSVDAKDTRIRPALASLNYVANIPIANITTTYDFSMYDIVILTEAPSSGSTGMKALWGINKPLLCLKMFAIQANTWNLSTATSPTTAVTGVTVVQNTHPIFSGITKSGTNSDEIQILGAITTGNGIQSSPYSSSYNLANIIGAATPGIIEFPIGTTSPLATGTATNSNSQAKSMILSIANDNQDKVTDDGITLIQNAITYLVGSTSWVSPTTGLQNTLTGITFDGQTIQNNNHQMITVFDATGRLVVTSDKDVNMNGYAKGIYMIRGEKGQLKIAYTK